jgi:hypothetical protein
MSNALISVELPEPLLEVASSHAEKAGTSVSVWIREMIAERVRNEELTERFFQRRLAGGDAEQFAAILDKAPDVPPIPGDEPN